MVGRLGRHLRQQYAGFLALFIALGGVSYAAATLPKNSVGSNQIKRSAVKGSELARNAVTGSKVRNGSLGAADFRTGQLPAGPTGQQGPPGTPGAPGEPATRLWVVVREDGSIYKASAAATTVRKEGTGEYAVSFPTAVKDCAVQATVGGYPVPGGSSGIPTGQISVGTTDAYGVHNGVPTERTVGVFTHNSAGALLDRSFHMAVFC